MNYSLLALIAVLPFLAQASLAQARTGTYSVLSLGTKGSHASDPGVKGVLTIASNGNISGTVYSYEDKTSTPFAGTVNLGTGRGSISDGRYTLDLRVKSSTRTFLDISYSKRGHSSRGIIWGVR